MTEAAHNPQLQAWEYPWLRAAWARTSAALDTLHHGLLITGVPGIAKREFGVSLGRLLLCAEPPEESPADAPGGATGSRRPCGRCRNCTLFKAATHPDFHVLITELERRDGRVELASRYCERYQDAAAREKRANPGRVIPVDQVRLLIERFHAHAHIAARKVALMMPADRMNANAANALLKLLEEPPANSVLLLVTAAPGYLPATVRSRCVQIAIPPPGAQTALTWLRERMPADEAARAIELSNGGPLDALKLHADGLLAQQAQFARGVAELADGKTDALVLAARLTQHDFRHSLDWLHRLSCELIKWRCGVVGASLAAGRLERIRANAGRLPVEALFALYDKIGAYRRMARQPLNEQLALEELTLALRQCFSASAVKGAARAPR